MPVRIGKKALKISGEDLLIALSLGNLFFLGDWVNFIWPRWHALALAPNYCEGLAALLAGVIGLSCLILGLLTLSRRLANGRLFSVSHLALAGLLVFPLNVVRTANNLPIRYPVLSRKLWGETLGAKGLWAVAALLFWLAFRYRDRLTRVLRRLLLSAFPFLLVTFGQVLWSVPYLLRVKDLRPRPERAAPAKNRVVWMIFDEMARKYTEPQAAEKLGLTSWSQLLAQSISATQALPPAPLTMLSIPTLIAGQPMGFPSRMYADLSTTFFDLARTGEIAHRDNLFADAFQAGYRVGVAGFYIPYCRLYGKWLSQCTALTDGDFDFSPSVRRNLRLILRRTMAIAGHYSLRNYSTLLDAAGSLTADSHFDLVYIHWPIPHPPGIYDPAGNRLSFGGEDEGDYLNNLRLMDNTLREIRKKMEASGEWEKTAVLVSADHAVHRYRSWAGPRETYDTRIPFVLKLPFQKQPARYESPFNSILQRRLILGLLSGELSSPERVAHWIDEQRRSEPPVDATSEPWYAKGMPLPALH